MLVKFPLYLELKKLLHVLPLQLELHSSLPVKRQFQLESLLGSLHQVRPDALI